MSYIDQIMYDAGGHVPGNDYYVRIMNRGAEIWDPTDKELKDESDITWAESVRDLVEEGQTGMYPVVIPHDSRTRDDIAFADYGKAYADLVTEHKSMEDPDRSAFADEESYERAKPTDPEKAIVAAQVAQKLAVDAKFALIKNLPGGVYDVVVYKYEQSDALSTDNVEKQYVLKHGSIFGF